MIENKLRHTQHNKVQGVLVVLLCTPDSFTAQLVRN